MFRCIRAPAAPAFEADLDKLGYTLNDRGQFVDKDGKYFDNFTTDNEHVNDVRKEAFKDGVRCHVARQLTRYGIEEIFLSGQGGCEISTSRPPTPHVSMLATKVSELKHKRDVFVIVGESDQDCGVWAWRLLGGEGGLQAGSAVGLAARIAAFEQSKRNSDFEEDWVNVTEAMGQMEFGEKAKAGIEDPTPGLIILNPGQLLYSNKVGKNMTLPSWNHRQRPDAYSAGYVVDLKHNKLKGHTNPSQHCHTVFERVVQQLVPEETRLYIICVGDGANAALDALDQIFLNKSEHRIRGGTVEVIALVEPKHDPQSLDSSELRMFLSLCGKSWVQSELPRGETVQLPACGIPEIQYAIGATVGVKMPANSPNKPPKAQSDSDTSSSSGGVKLEQSPERKDSTIPGTENAKPTPKTDNEEPPVNDSPDEEARPAVAVVSCATVSVGRSDGIIETVFPEVMGEVIDFFGHFHDMAVQHDRLVARRTVEKTALEARGLHHPRDCD